MYTLLIGNDIKVFAGTSSYNEAIHSLHQNYEDGVDWKIVENRLNQIGLFTKHNDNDYQIPKIFMTRNKKLQNYEEKYENLISRFSKNVKDVMIPFTTYTDEIKKQLKDCCFADHHLGKDFYVDGCIELKLKRDEFKYGPMLAFISANVLRVGHSSPWRFFPKELFRMVYMLIDYKNEDDSSDDSLSSSDDDDSSVRTGETYQELSLTEDEKTLFYLKIDSL